MDLGSKKSWFDLDYPCLLNRGGSLCVLTLSFSPIDFFKSAILLLINLSSSAKLSNGEVVYIAVYFALSWRRACSLSANLSYDRALVELNSDRCHSDLARLARAAVLFDSSRWLSLSSTFLWCIALKSWTEISSRIRDRMGFLGSCDRDLFSS